MTGVASVTLVYEKANGDHILIIELFGKFDLLDVMKNKDFNDFFYIYIYSICDLNDTDLFLIGGDECTDSSSS